MAAVVLPPNFALVGVGITATFIMSTFLSGRVMKARKIAGVGYPTMYVTDAEAKADPKKHMYNCTQRGHQNTLENLPMVLFMTIFLGVFHPRAATAFNLTWVVARVNYALGYASGNPKNRLGGIAKAQYIGLLGLFFGSIYTVYTHRVAAFSF